VKKKRRKRKLTNMHTESGNVFFSSEVATKGTLKRQRHNDKGGKAEERNETKRTGNETQRGEAAKIEPGLKYFLSNKLPLEATPSRSAADVARPMRMRGGKNIDL